MSTSKQSVANAETSRPDSLPALPSTSPSSSTNAPNELRLLGPEYRAATLGIVGLVALIAFEMLGSAAVMPIAVSALDGLALYGFVFGGPLAMGIIGMVAAGRSSDRRGPLPVVWAGGGCFVAGLLLAALAGSIGTLLLGRLLTGLGAGMLSVALYALVGRVYPARLHSKAFAAFAAAWMLPALLGPAGSGLVAEWFGWRWAIAAVAVLTAPVAALLLGMRIPPASTPAVATPSPPSQAQGLHWALIAAAGALALHVLGQSGFGPAAAGSAFAGAAMLAALVVLVVSARQLLPARTLGAAPGLPAAIALNGLSQGAFFAAEAFLPLLMHTQRGIPVGIAGLLLSAGAVSWTLGATYRARVHHRVSDRALLRAGFGLLASGITLSAAVLVPSVPVLVAIIGWAGAGAGMGLVSPTLSVKTLALAPVAEHGRTGASLRLSAALTTTSALALSGSLFALLLTRWPTGAFAASMALAASLAVCGLLIAHRTEVGGIGHGEPALEPA